MNQTSPDIEERQEAETAHRGRPGAGNDPAKRKQILDGARRVFIEMGFDAASMNDITRAAGVSKGTIYVYFANKEELFEALIEEERGAIFKNLYETLEQTGPLRDTLVPTAWTNDGLIMAMHHRTLPIYGVQFHPESIASQHGHDILANFLAIARGTNAPARAA